MRYSTVQYNATIQSNKADFKLAQLQGLEISVSLPNLGSFGFCFSGLVQVLRLLQAIAGQHGTRASYGGWAKGVSAAPFPNDMGLSMFVWKWLVPLNPMVLLIIIPIKWL